MYQRLILGIGSGRCGTVSLAHVLARQPDAGVSHEDPPLLPWRPNRNRAVLEQRFLRWRRQRTQALIGDVASFYLPYIEQAIALAPEIRVVCVKRPRAEVVESFCKWLARTPRKRPPPFAGAPAQAASLGSLIGPPTLMTVRVEETWPS